jgi:hypothetical protein
MMEYENGSELYGSKGGLIFDWLIDCCLAKYTATGCLYGSTALRNLAAFSVS